LYPVIHLCLLINSYPLINLYHVIDLYPVIGENTLASHPVTASFIFSIFYFHWEFRVCGSCDEKNFILGTRWRIWILRPVFETLLNSIWNLLLKKFSFSIKSLIKTGLELDKWWKIPYSGLMFNLANVTISTFFATQIIFFGKNMS
jgi:hypothetical protein